MTDVAERTVVETMSRNKNQVNLTYSLFQKDKKKKKCSNFTVFGEFLNLKK